MFIKIIQATNNGSNHTENVYEAEHYKVQHSDDEPGIMKLYITNPDCVAVCEVYDIDKETTGVFIMNDDGKTIDSFTWNPAQIRKMKNS